MTVRYNITIITTKVELGILGLCLSGCLALSSLLVEPEYSQDACPGSNGQLHGEEQFRLELKTACNSHSSCQQLLEY